MAHILEVRLYTIIQNLLEITFECSPHVDVFRMSGLHQAALMGNTEIMEVLLENGADVRLRDNKGKNSVKIQTAAPHPLPKNCSLYLNISIYHRVIWTKDADRLANSVDSDQSGLGLRCLPRPVGPKTQDHYGKFKGILRKLVSVYRLQ